MLQCIRNRKWCSLNLAMHFSPLMEMDWRTFVVYSGMKECIAISQGTCHAPAVCGNVKAGETLAWTMSAFSNLKNGWWQRRHAWCHANTKIPTETPKLVCFVDQRKVSQKLALFRSPEAASPPPFISNVLWYIIRSKLCDIARESNLRQGCKLLLNLVPFPNTRGPQFSRYFGDIKTSRVQGDGGISFLLTNHGFYTKRSTLKTAKDATHALLSSHVLSRSQSSEHFCSCGVMV